MKSEWICEIAATIPSSSGHLFRDLGWFCGSLMINSAVNSYVEIAWDYGSSSASTVSSVVKGCSLVLLEPGGPSVGPQRGNGIQSRGSSRRIHPEQGPDPGA